MQTPLRITFHQLDPSPAVRARVLEHLEHLERIHERITSCHVVVEAPPGHRRNGAPFSIKINLAVPGREVHVSTDGAAHPSHEDIYVALRDAFDVAKRRLQEGHPLKF